MIQTIQEYQDLTKREYFCLFPLIILTIFLGVAPDIIFNYTSSAVRL